MYVDRRAERIGAVLGAVPVLSNAAMVSLFELLSSDYLSEGQATTVVDTVLWPVSTANLVLLVGVLLVAPALAFYLAFPEDRDAGPVVVGFAVGAVVYGVGVAAVAWAGRMGTPFPGGFPRFAVWLALLFGGMAALGALAGDTVGPLFRTPEGADEQHPRW